MNTIEVSVSDAKTCITLGNKMIASKSGRGAWVNADGQPIDYRRFPSVVKAYVTVAQNVYKHSQG